LARQPLPQLDPAVADYYSRAPEESRLEHGPLRLEQARTRELIERHAPPPPATVLDVGGAAGAYALWLASTGYDVHLVDPVPRLVSEAAHYFTTAYFHRPDELALELTDAGLAVQGMYGIEGPGWLFPDIGERMQDDRRRTEVLHVARLLESEPSVLGASAHILAVAVRQGIGE
jgi:hypothetical protein